MFVTKNSDRRIFGVFFDENLYDWPLLWRGLTGHPDFELVDLYVHLSLPD